ncbi:MAG: molybdopterin biosynthesis protein MoeY [Caldimonas sp.]
MSVAEEIIELARWAPSGDNSQPWRFRILADDHIVVHAFDTRDHCVYDLEGHASQLAVGGMLETMRIAASATGRTLEAIRRPATPDKRPLFDVRVGAAGVVPVDDLVHAILDRSVQRRPMRTQQLGAARKAQLEAAVGPGARVVWFEGTRQKFRMAGLAARSAKIRLTIPEAYAVHREIIQWDARHSVDRVPDQALGASRATLALMRWAMHSWDRVDRMNRFAGGTIAPRVELDIVPALCCAGHFAILAESEPRTLDDLLAAGAAMQRFWLTATRIGLQLQPQYTPLVFAGYARHGIKFTRVTKAQAHAFGIAGQLDALLPGSSARAVFLGRLGDGPPAAARSLRLSLDDLCGGQLAPREDGTKDHASGVASES